MDLDPAVGSEANKTRTAIIVGRAAVAERAMERRSGVITVVPTTTRNLDKIFDFHLLIPAALSGLPADCKAQAEQIRSISVHRLVAQAGSLPPELSDALDERIRVWLNL